MRVWPLSFALCRMAVPDFVFVAGFFLLLSGLGLVASEATEVGFFLRLGAFLAAAFFLRATVFFLVPLVTDFLGALVFLVVVFLLAFLVVFFTCLEADFFLPADFFLTGAADFCC